MTQYYARMVNQQKLADAAITKLNTAGRRKSRKGAILRKPPLQNGKTTPHNPRNALKQWRPRQDSNLQPAD
jgi:hypothetical protein